MNYYVNIPFPSAKRMAGKKTLRIEAGDGWGQGWKREHVLTDETEFEFEVTDDTEWIGNTTCNDGMVFTVWVEYVNSTGSRKENIQLVPQIV